MGEIALDVAVANRFISSLSKSLQALCHGCMDFDSGIEIVGYINVNIDCGSKVDYVLNEKVQKSANNSMKFISNSFLAKKDQQKQTRDGSCSPVFELQTQSFQSSAYQKQSFQYPGSQHHRSYPYSSQILRGAQKRAWSGMERDWRAPKKHSRGARASYSQNLALQNTYSSPSATQTSHNSETFLQSEIPGSSNGVSNSDIQVKKELFSGEDQLGSGYSESDSVQNNEMAEANLEPHKNSAESSINIKKDPDAVSASEDDLSGVPSNSNKVDQGDNFLQPSSEIQQTDSSESTQMTSHTDNQFPSFEPSTSGVPLASELSQDNITSEHSEDPELPIGFDQSESDMSYPQSSYPEQAEASGDGSGFDVIEIEDEDEDMKAMFGDSHSVFQQQIQQQLHVTENEFQCRSCPANFQIQFQLKKHISECHGAEMPFTCPLCGKGYASLQGYQMHQFKHEGKRFQCPLCKCEVSQKSKIKVHLRNVHKCAPCLTCKQIISLEAFDQHMRQCW